MQFKFKACCLNCHQSVRIGDALHCYLDGSKPSATSLCDAYVPGDDVEAYHKQNQEEIKLEV